MANFFEKIRLATSHATRALFGVVLLLGAITTTDLYALTAGYTCPSNGSKTYIRCSQSNKRLSSTSAGNSCVSCPTGSSSNYYNDTTTCTCNVGRRVGGTPSGATTTSGSTCDYIQTTISLNRNVPSGKSVCGNGTTI